MKFIKIKKGFTLIELIVVMAIIGILVLLAMPKFIGYTEKARLTEIKSNTKQLENASERYYMDKQDWPKLSDTSYTLEQIGAFAKQVKDKTGAVVTLDPAGNYYDIDYEKLQKYMHEPKDGINYIIQNPVGEVYYLDELTISGQNRLSSNVKPTAVITMTPATTIYTTTPITWSYSASIGSIKNAEWQLDSNPVTSNPNGIVSTIGTHTMKLRVQNNNDIWSDWASKTFEVTQSKIGQKLTAPDVVWKRYDDNSVGISYIGSGWSTLANWPYYGGVRHQSSSTVLTDKMSFSFSGTKLRIISSSYINYSNDLYIIIDGIKERFSQTIISDDNQILTYEKNGLENAIHTVEIGKTSSGTYMYDLTLDAIDIDDIGSLLVP